MSLTHQWSHCNSLHVLTLRSAQLLWAWSNNAKLVGLIPGWDHLGADSVILVGPFKPKIFCNKLPLSVIFIRSILKSMYFKMKSYIYYIMEHHYKVQVPDGSQVYVGSHTHRTNSWGTRHDFSSAFSLYSSTEFPAVWAPWAQFQWTVGTERAQPHGPIFSLFLQLLKTGKRKSGDVGGAQSESSQ